MQGDQHPTLVLLRKTRERVLEQLSDAFTKDLIGLDEFEKRVDEAYSRRAPDELLELVRDLTPLAAAGGGNALVVTEGAIAEVVSKPAPAELVVRGAARPRGVVAVFSNIERRGRFPLETGTRIAAVCGNIELDLRDHSFPDGVTELFVRAVLGNVELTVPPTVAIECEGSGFLGSFATVSRVPAEGTGGPVLRIVGSAVLGNVEIRTRPRGGNVPLLPGSTRR